MTTKFNNLWKKIIAEAELPEFGNKPDESAPNNDPAQADPAMDPEVDLSGLEELDASVPPEEIELGKLAVRALNFNTQSKDVHQYNINVNGNKIPFEKISDYFEQTKNWKPVLQFVEWVMNKYEGQNSKWSEEKGLLGKSIVQKIAILNRDKSDPSKLLDTSKRITWTRIILNCLLHSDPSFNLVGTDITEENLPDIFNLLKQHFNNNSRGLFSTELKGPSNN